MTTEAWFVMQFVLSAAIVLVAGVRLVRVVHQRGTPGDGDRLHGFAILAVSALLLAVLTPLPTDPGDALAVLGVKLTWVGVLTGIAFNATLSGIEKNRHRRALEKLLRERNLELAREP